MLRKQYYFFRFTIELYGLTTKTQVGTLVPLLLQSVHATVSLDHTTLGRSFDSTQPLLLHAHSHWFHCKGKKNLLEQEGPGVAFHKYLVSMSVYDCKNSSEKSSTSGHSSCNRLRNLFFRSIGI